MRTFANQLTDKISYLVAWALSDMCVGDHSVLGLV